MLEIFDPAKGIVSEKSEYVRDVTEDLERAEKIIRELKGPMFIEDLIKLVQKTCSLTNNEVFEIVQKVNAELQPKEEPKPITE